MVGFLRGGGRIKNTLTLAFHIAILKFAFIAVARSEQVFPYTPKKDPTPNTKQDDKYLHPQIAKNDFTQERGDFVRFFFGLCGEREGLGFIEDGKVGLRGGGWIKKILTSAVLLAIFPFTFIKPTFRSKEFPFTQKNTPHQHKAK